MKPIKFIAHTFNSFTDRELKKVEVDGWAFHIDGFSNTFVVHRELTSDPEFLQDWYVSETISGLRFPYLTETYDMVRVTKNMAIEDAKKRLVRYTQEQFDAIIQSKLAEFAHLNQ